MNKEYIVVANLALTTFVAECNKQISDGATPLGGLHTNHHGLYTQAFLKEQQQATKKKVVRRGRPRKENNE